MLRETQSGHQENLFYTDLMLQLDEKDPLIQLSCVIKWKTFDEEFSRYYNTKKGRPSLPIRLLVGAGVQLRMSEGMHGRLEYNSYDRDARYLVASMIFYLSGR